MRQEDWTVENLLEEWSLSNEITDHHKLAFLERCHELNVELLKRGVRIKLDPAPEHIIDPCILPDTYWPVALACVLDLVDPKQDHYRLPDIIDLLFNAGLIDHRHAVMCRTPEPELMALSDEEFAEQFGTTPEEYNRLTAKPSPPGRASAGGLYSSAHIHLAPISPMTADTTTSRWKEMNLRNRAQRAIILGEWLRDNQKAIRVAQAVILENFLAYNESNKEPAHCWDCCLEAIDLLNDILFSMEHVVDNSETSYGSLLSQLTLTGPNGYSGKIALPEPPLPDAAEATESSEEA